MAAIYFYTIISVLIISLLSLAGVFTLLLSREKLKSLTIFLVSLSAGALLGNSFLHLIPEAVAKNGNRINLWLWLLAGILLFFSLEKIVHWRHCHQPTTATHPHPVGVMN